ncbi:MAG: mechanosensitive ion channel [Eubacterium sp.]|nr:mechanosensitive ion channel [Eubacterium sp.]
MSAAIITLCVAVATFILQEGITNIIHGIIFRLFSNVHIGDRIEILIDGTTYTGSLSKITIRHVVINDFQTNAEIIIPNSKIDCSLIKNTYNGLDQHNRYIVELPVSYMDAENKEHSDYIKEVIKSSVVECPLTIDTVNDIYIAFKESYVGYTFFIKTNTIEENFRACSWIRENLMQELSKKDIHIPYSTLNVNINDNI